MNDTDRLKALIRHVPDFPKPGILFYDISTLLSDPSGLRLGIDCLVKPFQDRSVDRVVGIESRGFIFGCAVAEKLGVGFVPVRKPGKLPAETVRAEYDLEYGTDVLEMHRDALHPGEKVLVIDDLLATGGTAQATADLVSQVGATVCGFGFLIELTSLKGRDRLIDHEVFSALRYE
jgi:adenine phosphoribosyltransferase